MNIDALRTELVSDPLTRGYAGMTDAQAAASLNQVNRTRNRTSVPTSEIIRAVVYSEYIALGTTAGAVAARTYLQTLIASGGTVDVNDANVIAALQAIFTQAAAPTTRANLQSLRTEAVSRATEIGLDRAVESYDVAKARG